MDRNEIIQVAAHFRLAGEVEAIAELTAGLINNSYRLTCRGADGVKEYVLQQINTYVFKKPEEVMSNVQRVTEHLRRKLVEAGEDPARRALHLIETTDGGNLYHDEQDRHWRVYDFITDALTRDHVDTAEQFRQVGAAFGEFQKMLFDFPAAELYETIPSFHDTRKRFETFRQAVATDRAGRVKDLAREISFFLNREEMMSSIVVAIEKGELPLRVTHNDTKTNNVMLDAQTGNALCVIDLDTVMPGSALYDYGDALRFGASIAAEDEEDLSKISLDMDYFRAFTDGFVSQVRSALTDAELKRLPLGLKVITCELAMRFLTDYIDGDLYFKINRPDHNLVRARAQMRLLEDIEARYDEMCAYTARLTKN